MQWKRTNAAFVALAYLGGLPAVSHAQNADPPAINLFASGQCPPPISFAIHQSVAPYFLIAKVTFEGNLSLPNEEQEAIAASIKRRTDPESLDEVIADLEKNVGWAWQEHGYFNVQVRGNAETLNADLAESRIAVDFQVDEGQQFRLGGISLENNKAIINVQALRSLFAINDGDVYNVAEINKGFEKLSYLYREFGYFHFTYSPATRVVDGQQTIWLDIELDEGKQFRVSTVHFHIADENSSQRIAKHFLLKPGDVYNERLLESSKSSLSAPNSVTYTELEPDDLAGTIAITTVRLNVEENQLVNVFDEFCVCTGSLKST